MDVLETIVARKRLELARLQERLPAATLAQLVAAVPPPRGFAQSLLSAPGPRVIAEVKRASPVKGVLRTDVSPLDWRPEALAQAYADNGARALSVLTDVSFFWGNPEALALCRAATTLPALRKDFILEPYQVDESRWLGADAVLLMVRILDDATLLACAARARALKMDVLVEIHADDELTRALRVPEAIIGVNHRDLGTMSMDMERAVRLRPRVPHDRLMVAESGLSRPEDLTRLMNAGIDTFLIGEAVAKQADPGRALAELTRR